MTERNDGARYCIIGAGAAGITAAKNLLAAGIGFDVIEREDDVGGNWYYGRPSGAVYRSIHMISSKRFSEYTDFPIPDDYPTYARGDQALAYLRAYARRFGVYDRIEFGRSVLEIAPVAGGSGWRVELDRGEVRTYRGVIVCNGHLSHPQLPDYPGRFDGLQLHSSQYRTPEIFRDRRVLVVGAGNSGCDIAVEASHHARAVFHSTRRGYYYWPKFLFGIPADQWAEWPLRLRMPLWARRFFGERLLRLTTAGQPEDYGLRKPDHKLFESHFIINSTLFYHLGHGDLDARPDVRELKGDRVVFADGREEPVDVIVYATGYRPGFPFIDQAHLQWRKQQPSLYLNMFDAQHRDLFFIGLFQTSTGNWPLMDYQAQLLARYLHARDAAPRKAAHIDRLIRRGKSDWSGGIAFHRTPRHVIEVEHFAYRLQLQRLIRGLPAVPGAAGADARAAQAAPAAPVRAGGAS
ncbi:MULTISPECIES: flavin-containing monooxygenase [Burkholderia]|uniref:flavin-containing monooxygenase n=1 Tax=Burkholderia TaxID=32008 RepID=UPI001CF22BB5|nr:NAD(P)-binding domain-containing protein [Burkholderia cepacia]MCA8054823.1 NAD(P)-binding domain-containing protein [Burkholderia cepacia]MCA8132713.1 NAD(P)-binding domain-containing protein [Burkholderia cepacia]MDN7635291.1 NAD(P)-binding domain-containing protein [Burkholderia cepacia]HEM7895583.1 NAD(P)-binding domain-containing protein [Burkholderia cepacia]HEM8515738.1 NAD(P)-binding domain-containing protein [Burkholderia cepacia]